MKKVKSGSHQYHKTHVDVTSFAPPTILNLNYIVHNKNDSNDFADVFF